MKKYFTTLLIASSSIMFAQSFILDDKFDLEFKKVVKNSRLFELHTSQSLVTASKGFKKIQIKFKLKSISKEKEDFDPNKFFMITETFKKRVRPADVKYSSTGGIISFDMLVYNELTEDEKNYMYKYDPSVIDTFPDYKKEGYEDLNTSLNFGTKKKPDNREIYFGHSNIRSSRIDVYFSVPLELTHGTIYYGSLKLMDFEVK